MSGAIDEDLMYDTYISYHSADKEWVTEILIKNIEEQTNLKICWDDRDFEPGKTIIENKLNAICSSASTVVILSPDYVHSEDLWVQLNKHCGFDDEEIIEEFNLIPVVFRLCTLPQLFTNLWKLDWVNKTTKQFFWEKLFQSLKKCSDYAKINDSLPSYLPFKDKLISKQSPKERKSFMRTAKCSELEINQELTTIENSRIKIEDRIRIEELSKEDDTKQFIEECAAEEKHFQKSEECLTNGHCETDQNILKAETNSSSSCHQMTEKGILIEDSKHEESMSRVLDLKYSGFLNTFPCKEDENTSDDEKDLKLLENINPRILSFFVTEDEDLSRNDVEELTLKIENVFLEDSSFAETEDDVDEESFRGFEEKKFKSRWMHKEKSRSRNSNLVKFNSQQEQILVLDLLQEKEIRIRRKFENCCDCGRKRVYRRLLERFDNAIFHTVNGEKDTELLASLPISADYSLQETRGFKCCCCDQFFHSERALQMHVSGCVRQAWMVLVNDLVPSKMS